MNLNEVVNIDKDILDGRHVFKGTRVPIENLFDYLRAGDSLNDFLNDFDYIPKEHCLAVLDASQQLLTKTLTHYSSNIKASDFRGTLKLTGKQYQDFQQHVKDMRDEWDRDI